ncbi:MAG TPA: PhoH family protein [Elusimicrobiales bacterium]|nr:PhoH family protein [Elusimicrobiales bacterium]HOL61786.1 PhoH family protein [Elusimicrobiales bacterium]
MKKTFILDTNVLIHDPLSFLKFQDNIVIIPIAVIEELDTFKNYADEKGKNVRIVSRKLDELRASGRLDKGVKTKDGGIIKIEMEKEFILPDGFTKNHMDNRILNTAYSFYKKNKNTILVSKDINLRLKAEAIGLRAEDYETGKVNIDELYSGSTVVEVDDSVIEEFYKNKHIKNSLKVSYPNEFVILKSNSDSKKAALGRIPNNDTSVIKNLSPEQSPWGIKPLNKEQRFAMELLLDDNIKLITLLGSAGTGKTLISLACGLHKTVDTNTFRRVVVCRSIVPVGRDIGYLPGTKDEKLQSWMGAIYDNLEFIMDKKHPEEGIMKFDYLMQQNKIEIASVTHIRGRSLPKQYMIVDDAQNLTPHEIKTILSRAGAGTKVVVTGDPYQIDNPYLDIASNGLTYIVDRFKGQSVYGHVTFTKTERSELARLVSELL